MKAYSLDLRQRVVQAVARGMSKSEAASHFDVSLSSVKRYVKLNDQSGQLTGRPRPGREGAINGEKLERLRQLVEAAPDKTLDEQAVAWEKEYGVKLSRATFSRTLKRLRITYKKKP